MCGRFTLTAQDYKQLTELLKAEFDAAFAAQYRPRYNIAPGDIHWILISQEKPRQLLPAKWGLVPSWAKDDKGFINARAESIHEKPSFRSSFQKRRCAIPADGFYEWTGDKKDRRPIWFHRNQNDLFLFAGLYRDRTNATTGNLERTFTILTTAANKEIQPIHDRMPVILPNNVVDTWISTPAPKDREETEDLLSIPSHSASENLIQTPVSRRVNSPRFDDPDCIQETS